MTASAFVFFNKKDFITSQQIRIQKVCVMAGKDKLTSGSISVTSFKCLSASKITRHTARLCEELGIALENPEKLRDTLK